MPDDIKHMKSGRKKLREFGLTIGVVLVILGCVAIWRGWQSYPYLMTAGILSAVLGLITPIVLLPVQKIWMAFAAILGFFVSRIALLVFFYLVVTPIGFLIRISGKDILDQKIEKDRSSYWVARTGAEKTKERHEDQY